MTSKTVSANRPKDIEAFLRGFIDGIRLYKANPALAEKIMGKYTRVTDRAMLRETYDTFNRELAAQPFTPKEAIANMLQLIAETEPKAAKANPEDFLENQFMQNLRTSGYFKP